MSDPKVVKETLYVSTIIDHCLRRITCIQVCSGGRNQFPAKSYLIVARHSGQGLDVRNAGGALAIVQTAGFGEVPNREWIITPSDEGYYTIAAKHSKMLLDVRDAGGNLSTLQTGGFGTLKNREFSFARTPDGFHVISARHSGLSLDVVEAKRWMATVQTAGHGGQPNREWLLLPSDFRAPEYASRSTELFRTAISIFLKAPCDFEFADCDGRVIVIVPIDFLRAKCDLLVKNEFPKFAAVLKNPKIEQPFAPHEGGLKCRLRISEPFEGWVDFLATVNAWPTREPHMRVEVNASRADGLFQELLKAIFNADKQANEKIIPSFNTHLQNILESLPFWKSVQLVGIQNDRVIFVLAPGALPVTKAN
ncbi:RICIN domain-containing protein [bacterium]|nr:RICIN domain-containing protein [bacterium]